MQTFLPCESFTESAKCLDNKRLGKQRVEAFQILRTLLGLSEGWKRHPAIRMWQGYERALFTYAVVVCQEWVDRGFRDTVRHRLWSMEVLRCLPNGEAGDRPLWLTEEFCRSHQSNLLRKNAEHYGQFGWDVPDDLPYVWPEGKKETEE